MKYEATLGSRRKIQKNIVWGSAGSRHMQHAFRRDGISSTVQFAGHFLQNFQPRVQNLKFRF